MLLNKGSLTMNSWVCSAFILTGLLSPNVYSAAPSPSQLNMTKQIETAIEWTSHMRDEVRKGTKSNPNEIKGDLAGIKSFLSAMSLTAGQIVLESPSEKTEGHFTEMRRFQDAATFAAKDFPIPISGKNPNFSKMKAATKEIMANLENAKHWHELELSEIGKHQQD